MTRTPRLSTGVVAGSTSMLLRVMSLGSKLALSLFMGKYFSLSEMGLYGLAFGTVMLAVVFLGFRVDYAVAREILGMDEGRQRQVSMEVALVFLVCFFVAAPFTLLGFRALDVDANWPLIVLVYTVCGIEAYSNYLYTVTISLKRPALANALFFVRSGLWPIPVMAIAFFRPELRTVEFVFAFWLVGTGGSVLLNLWFMRRHFVERPRRAHMRVGDVRHFVGRSLLIWLGSVAITLGGYLDRFVLARYLSLSDVGVATFYTSFTISVLTLVQSATTNVTLPTMMEHYDGGRIALFEHEVWRTAKIALGTALVVLIGLAVAMPVMGRLLGKHEILAAYPAFCLLLLATLVRTHAETLYSAIYTERKHRAIWLGNVVFFAASLGFNLLLIPRYGLVGLGVAAIFAAIVVLLYRAIAYHGPRGRRGAAPSTTST